MKLASERRSSPLKRAVSIIAPLSLCAFALAIALLAACGAEAELVRVHNDFMAQGPTSPEELIFISEIIARARLLSAEPGSMLYYGEAAPIIALRFRVIEYLKGSGEDELTVRVIAKYTSSDEIIVKPAPDADDALKTAKSRIAWRDARWDDREALVFLRSSTVPEETGFYEFSWRFPGPTRIDYYAITSAENRAWLPAIAPSEDDAASEARYLTYASLPESPSAAISLSEVESLIEANADMLAKGEGIPGYNECIKDKFKFDAEHKNSLGRCLSLRGIFLPVSPRDIDFGLYLRGATPVFIMKGGGP